MAFFVLTATIGCEPVSKQDEVVITGPDNGLIEGISQDLNLLRPPGGFEPPQWNPGDPTVVPGDLRETSGVTVGIRHESFLKRWMRRFFCKIFRCRPKPPRKPSNPTTVDDENVIDGIPGTQYVVPDTVGDVGFDYYVQAVNSAFQVFDKIGNSITTPLYLNVLWVGIDSPCAREHIIDPIVRFDAKAERWLISGFVWVNANPDSICIAVSKTSDPVTGGWFLYDIPAYDGITNQRFSLDFPKLGVWSDSYFISSLRGWAGDNFLGLDVWALERNQMLNGATAGITRFHMTGPFVALLPADIDGAAPPDDSPGWFARQVDGERFSGDDRIEIWKFEMDWANVGAASFALADELQTESFDSVLCDFTLIDPCVSQPVTPQKLETLGAWPQWRLQYRNLGEDEVLLFNHTIDIAGTSHAGIRWYELRKPLAGPWSIAQQGNHFSEDHEYFMGSISMDNKGNIALGYSASGSEMYPGIHIAHRNPGDAPGSMPGAEHVAITGGGSQLQENFRWGNYSTMDVDPEDDCTFWYTSEYYKSSSEAGWSTAIASFRLDGCGGY